MTTGNAHGGWQNRALAQAHIGWLAPLDAALVDAARASPIGRRMLARRLSAAAPALFGRPPTVSAENMPASGAAYAEPPDEETLLELGARALSPWWRTLVARESVQHLRGALGASRYQRLLQHPLPATAFDDTAFVRQPADARHGPGQLRTQFMRQGVAEWQRGLAAATDAHVEYLRLCIDPALARDMPAPCLRAAAIEEVLTATGTSQRR